MHLKDGSDRMRSKRLNLASEPDNSCQNGGVSVFCALFSEAENAVDAPKLSINLTRYLKPNDCHTPGQEPLGEGWKSFKSDTDVMSQQDPSGRKWK